MKRKRKQLSKEDIQQRNKLIVNLREKKYTLQKIADVFGITRERVRQISSPNYKHENTREKILLLDNYECQFCRSKEKLQVHHLNRDRKNNNINNLITLCYECHRKLHAGLFSS